MSEEDHSVLLKPAKPLEAVCSHLTSIAVSNVQGCLDCLFNFGLQSSGLDSGEFVLSRSIVSKKLRKTRRSYEHQSCSWQLGGGEGYSQEKR